MRYDIILTTFNRLEYTKRTIASLIQSGAIADCERFIIVDNRSTEEGMQEFLETLYQDASIGAKLFLLRREKNDGWGTAVNDALGISRAPYLFLSNNDVEYSSNFIEKMKSVFLENETIGILGVWAHTSHRFTGQNTLTFRSMDNVPAIGWMIPKTAMEKVGMLPEHGPCFTKGGNGEDTAYVNRMHDAGYLVGVPWEDLATHIDGY